jgi:uncharacterized protein
MENKFGIILSKEFSVPVQNINNIIELIEDGKTIPFIARYRKELHGGLDDQVLREIADRLSYLQNLDKRKAEIIKSITEQGKMTDEIAEALEKAATLVEVEDIYRPFKQKRKTRASVARERGLAPLAEAILAQDRDFDPETAAADFITEDVPTAADALAGASDIIAEIMSDDAELRKTLRSYYHGNGSVVSKAVNAANPDGDSVYRNYYDFAEPVSRIAGHRVLAIDRGEREEKLKVGIEVLDRDKNRCDSGVNFIFDKYLSEYDSPSGEIVKNAAADSLKRLIFPSIERELRSELTEKADDDAIRVFGENLRQLLLQPPIKDYIVLGLDPGFRTGCKLAVVDSTGKVLETGVAYITTGEGAGLAQGIKTIKAMISKHGVNVIAIGNGTASRESESVIADLIAELPSPVHYIIVSEAGASVYSASKLAAQEFPDYDVSLRSAVSIARRLQDPLAELVKIEPKAIGVGQYQHDMPPAKLDSALSGVVEDCVNAVGVDLNTASHSLLSYISGINASIAKNIVAFRDSAGKFTDRRELLKVPKLGPKAYELCAGFLRIPGGKNPLDNTSVHPESYAAAQGIIEELGETLGTSFANGSTAGGTAAATAINPRAMDKSTVARVAAKLGIGVPTAADIISELQKPGRDPRDDLPRPLLRSGSVLTISDLTPGMELEGTVRNVIDFGAFIDIGVHEDGLVHVSQLANRFVRHPLEVVKVGQVVKVKVLEVDARRKRISLTMKNV